MRSVRIALAAGLAITAAAAGGVLSESPLTVLATNSVTARDGLVVHWQSASACQQGELLPAGTAAIRLAIAANVGPAIAVAAFAGAHVLASGSQRSGWTGKTVTIPLRPVSGTSRQVRVCFAAGPIGEGVSILGESTRQAGAALASRRQIFAGRMGVEYLGRGHKSWLALAPSVAGHMALGRAWSGTWVVFLVAALMLALATLVSTLSLSELGDTRGDQAQPTPGPATPGPRPQTTPGPRRLRLLRRLPRAAWVCALVATLNAASWSFITPPFQVPDEPSHFAYVKQLAETGTLPTSSSTEFSSEEEVALTALRYSQIRQDSSQHAILSPEQQLGLDEQLDAFARSGESRGSAAAGVATSEPPLYYALESIPYRLDAGGTLLERLQLMRLLSALLAGVTAAFAFLFLREALPRARWAWSVGALAIALTPLFAFMSGGVNPDALLFAVCAALFYCLARAFRRGLTMRWAIATGLALAAGFLTKLSFVGLVPGALLALLLIAIHAARSSGRGALRPAAAAAAIGCAPVALLAVRDALSGAATFGIFAGTIRTTGGSLLGAANYIWQLYLPRLPGTANDFPGLATTRQIWFDRFVGRFGWFDTYFPGWVYTAALIVAAVLAALCVRAVLANRSALRERAAELSVYAVMTLGLLLLVGAVSYREFPALTADYGQPHYLLPLLPLLGALVALAARGAGRRWGPAAGMLLVVLFLAYDLFSQLQVIARYYG
jgi:Predicted membrane protein (DUF2142)